MEDVADYLAGQRATHDRQTSFARARGLLWELARAKRSALTDDGQMYALLVPGDLLDRIDDYIGYDEMGQ